MEAHIPFLKKLNFPRFSLDFLKGKPGRVVGIDIGVNSTKVVQLKYEAERAILETYGELLSEGYLKGASGGGGGFLRYLDTDVAALLKDVLKESDVTTKEAVLSIPAAAAFVTTISFPKLTRGEIEQAIPYEARKYVPIPISEVALDWDIFEPDEDSDTLDSLIVAVPREFIEKFRRISQLAEINMRAVEVETFSLVRSLVGLDQSPSLIVDFGSGSTTVAIADKGRLRVSHHIGRGSHELTKALERGLGINQERAEAIKREVGLSDRMEEREITSIIAPLVETLFAEVERIFSLYNRKVRRKIQKINLTGGGSNLKGLVDHTSTKFGVEVAKGNPFARLVAPAFMQPMLREIGPSFSVAAGLALHEIASR